MSVEEHRENLLRQKEQVSFDIKDLLSSTEELLRTTASYTGAEIEQARQRLRGQMDSAKRYASDWNSLAQARYQEVSAATEEYVHANPWRALGIAALIGLIAGHCLKGSGKQR